MTRPPSSAVMSLGRCGRAGSGGCASSAAPSAMPTRSAPSARAFALMSAAVRGFLKTSTTAIPPSLPLPCGERVGVRGPCDGCRRLRLGRAPPHPALSPWGGRKGGGARGGSSPCASALAAFRALALPAFEILELARDDALV